MVDRPTLHAAAEALSTALRQGTRAAPRLWGANLDQALSRVEDAARGGVPWAPSGGADPDEGIITSSGFDRKVGELSGALEQLALMAASLRFQLGRVASAEEGADLRLLLGFRLQAETVLETLRGLERREDALALALATTDLGAGD